MYYDCLYLDSQSLELIVILYTFSTCEIKFLIANKHTVSTDLRKYGNSEINNLFLKRYFCIRFKYM